MTRFLYDANVFLYAVGADTAYRSHCRRIVKLAGEGALSGEASVAMVQELLLVLSRRPITRADAAGHARACAALCRLHAFEPPDLQTAIELCEEHAWLGARDAVHPATALNREIAAVLSADRVFDRIPGVTRVDPADTAAVDGLAR